MRLEIHLRIRCGRPRVSQDIITRIFFVCAARCSQRCACSPRDCCKRHLRACAGENQSKPWTSEEEQIHRTFWLAWPQDATPSAGTHLALHFVSILSYQATRRHLPKNTMTIKVADVRPPCARGMRTYPWNMQIAMVGSRHGI